MRAFVLLFGLVVAVLSPSPAAARTAPVDAPVIDGWRPPLSEYGPGNRGIDYATTPGTGVRAAADGRVSFAGRVAGRVFVVVDHGRALRTTYGELAEALVVVGQVLTEGEVVGRSGSRLHFGVRDHGVYVDPGSFLGGRAHLVPVDAPPPAPTAKSAGVWSPAPALPGGSTGHHQPVPTALAGLGAGAIAAAMASGVARRRMG